TRIFTYRLEMNLAIIAGSVPAVRALAIRAKPKLSEKLDSIAIFSKTRSQTQDIAHSDPTLADNGTAILDSRHRQDSDGIKSMSFVSQKGPNGPDSHCI